MVNCRKILELYFEGVSQRTISSSTGHSRNTVFGWCLAPGFDPYLWKTIDSSLSFTNISQQHVFLERETLLAKDGHRFVKAFNAQFLGTFNTSEEDD